MGGGDDLQRYAAALCGSLSQVLEYAESSSRSLLDVVSEPPVRLDLAAASFLRKVNGLTSAAAADLQHIESMTCGTISTAELLGHCDEALNVFARHADAIQERLISFGYVPPEEESEEDDAEEADEVGAPATSCFGGSSSVPMPYCDLLGNDVQFEESVSLKDLGLSETCLALHSSKDAYGSTTKLHDKPESAGEHQKNRSGPELIPPSEETNGQEGLIKASKEEYERLPHYMKALASWEELQEAITTLNSYFGGESANGSFTLNQDDAGKVGLGQKGRSYLLLLLRLNQLTMEEVDGDVFYTLRKNDS